MTTANLTHEIATQTGFAVYAARKAKEEALVACIKGWGNKETGHSDKLKAEIADLLALQIYWEKVATAMLDAAIKKQRETMAAEVKAIKQRAKAFTKSGQ